MYKKNEHLICVLGSGSFGSAIAVTIASRNDVLIWTNQEEVYKEISEKRTNENFVKGVKIPANVKVFLDLEQALKNSDIVLFTVPSQATREVALRAKPYIDKNVILVSLAKGLEQKTEQRMSEVLREIYPDNPIVVLSGPSLAQEVAMGIPTTIVAASTDLEAAEYIQESLVTPTFRIYTTEDVIGVEMGGMLKNIIALASGINDGLGFGANSRAALINRGLAEMIRFGKAMNAKSETFLGLSGLGDLIVTCNSTLSRNFSLGFKIGRGLSLKEALAEMTHVCEGVYATEIVYNMAIKKDIEMPITNEVYNILFCGKNAKQAVKDLMTRSIKPEKII
jgi:glycerol-3-phosphate dehydrogenase (NAD(P)+)